MISEQLYQFISLDFAPLLTAACAGMACALLGNFLVLRRLSLMGDAISHAVLPGIVLAFLLSGSRASGTVFIGAAAAGVTTAVLVELVRKFGRLETGAAMGVVFSIMFALGVLMMEQAAARNVDLDADCLLHGQLETIFWYPPTSWNELFSLRTMAQLPSEVITSVSVFVLSLIFVLVFFKELALSAFDPGLSTALGFNATLLHYLLMIFVAAAVVASFEAVGSILVIGMIICPAATARFFTDRLRVQIVLSALLALIAAIGGYLAAALGPLWLGYGHSVNAGGMMIVVAGIIMFGAALFAPRYGIVAKSIRRMVTSYEIRRQDILADLYRVEEGAQIKALPRGFISRLAEQSLINGGDIIKSGAVSQLSDQGRTKAQSIIRKHRLWESFLVDQAGLQPDHVHESAEQLEHFTPPILSEKLAAAQSHSSTDPHGKIIPEE